jgi:uncharacterized repeat protein (TIGR01451 family)
LPASVFILSTLIAAFSGIPRAAAEGPDDPIPTDPFEAPSAAYEAYQLTEAGLMEQPPPAGPPSEGPSFALGLFALLGGDVVANNPGDDTPENTTQSETTLAVLGETLIAGYNNSGAGGLSGLSRSTDLGANWTDLGGIGQSGDPVLAVHQATGTVYYAELAGFAGLGGNPGIGVAISTNGGQTFPTLVNASAVATTLTGSQDKPWIAVDNTGGAGDGNIYVCWTRFFLGTSELRFSRSIDGGNTYQNEQPLTLTGMAPFGCSIAVGPAGEVYVSWADRNGPTAGNINFRSSTDGGVNFNPQVQVNSAAILAPGTDRVVNCLDFNRTTLNGNIRMLHQTWMAVDTTGGPFDGNIYIAWGNDPAGAVDNSDVLFSRSTDGGTMWSPQAQLGAGGGATDQFEPFVAVGGAGAVSVAWYDRRNDGANNLMIDVYKAFSEDGGSSFDPIIRVTDVNFPVPPILPNFDVGIRSCYMGEYIAIAGDAHNFYYLWGDNRNTVVSANWPLGRPDPDVWFDSQPAPVVNDADLRIEKSDTPDPVVAGENLTYTVTAFNDGPDIALDVVVTDTLPAGVTYVSDTGGCDTTALPVMTCSVGTLASGDSFAFDIVVQVDADLASDGVTAITNNASITGVANDPDPSDNSVSEDTSIAQADIAITAFSASALPDEMLIGDTVDGTLSKTVANNGPYSPIDVDVDVTSAPTGGISVAPSSANQVIPDLAMGTPAQVQEEFTLTCSGPGPQQVTFTDTVAPIGAIDPDLSDNTAEVTVEIECVIPVTINIHPGSFPNSINLKSKQGVVPVAILTTAAGEYGLPLAVDATMVDPLSVHFGPTDLLFNVDPPGGATEFHGRGHIEDSFELDETTQDGDLDLVLHFQRPDTGLNFDDSQACVKGTIEIGGMTFAFFGCDSISPRP